MNPRIGSLFSGYGGLDSAVEAVTGAEPAWFVEFDAAPSKILKHHWPDVPNFGDVTSVDWATVPRVDILTGGTPCQDLSQAGKRAGMTEGTRSNLWVNMREAINIIRPRLVVWENVQGALSATATSDSDMEPGTGPVGDGGGGHLRALGRVLGDLAEIGYDTAWTTLRASDVGAPHHRARVFLIGYPQEVPDPEGRRRDHGAATHDGQADREVHSPRNDSHTPANADGESVREHPGGPSSEEAGAYSGDRSLGSGGERATGNRGGRCCRHRTRRWGSVAHPRSWGGKRPSGQPRQVDLNTVVVREMKVFPTPAARDGTSGSGQSPAKRRAGGHSVNLTDAITEVSNGDNTPPLFAAGSAS